MVVIDEDRFVELVEEALGLIPSELAELIDNVAFFVEDRGAPPDLLGLYEGVPLTDRHEYGNGEFPDRITVYRLAILDACRNEAEVIDEVRITVIHEVAHHFGIEDDRLQELGWD